MKKSNEIVFCLCFPCYKRFIQKYIEKKTMDDFRPNLPGASRKLNIWTAITFYSTRLYFFGFPFVWDGNFQICYFEKQHILRIWQVINILSVLLHGTILPAGLLVRQLFLGLDKLELKLLVIVFFSVGSISSLYTASQIISKNLYGEEFAFGLNQLTSLNKEVFQSKFRFL